MVLLRQRLSASMVCLCNFVGNWVKVRCVQECIGLLFRSTALLKLKMIALIGWCYTARSLGLRRKLQMSTARTLRLLWMGPIMLYMRMTPRKSLLTLSSEVPLRVIPLGAGSRHVDRTQ